MKKQVIVTALTGSAMFIAFGANAQKPGLGSVKIPVEWVNSIEGDFSFTNKWSYSAFMYKDQQGEFRYYFPTSRMEGMFDANDKLHEDSVEMYYKLVDTNHIPHGIQWESDCYPKKPYATARLYVITSPTRIYVSTEYGDTSSNSNCKLRLNIENDSCRFNTVLLDMLPILDQLYNGTGGYIKIDKKLWKRGILKAEFYCTCVHSANPDDTHYWKGIIWVDLKDEASKRK